MRSAGPREPAPAGGNGGKDFFAGCSSCSSSPLLVPSMRGARPCGKMKSSFVRCPNRDVFHAPRTRATDKEWHRVEKAKHALRLQAELFVEEENLEGAMPRVAFPPFEIPIIKAADRNCNIRKEEPRIFHGPHTASAPCNCSMCNRSCRAENWACSASVVGPKSACLPGRCQSAGERLRNRAIVSFRARVNSRSACGPFCDR